MPNRRSWVIKMQILLGQLQDRQESDDDFQPVRLMNNSTKGKPSGRPAINCLTSVIRCSSVTSSAWISTIFSRLAASR